LGEEVSYAVWLRSAFAYLRLLSTSQDGDTLGQFITSIGLVALACALGFLVATYVSPEWWDAVRPAFLR